MSALIDPRADVSPKAELGANVSIGPFTVVEDGAVIGDGTAVAATALIASGARIGKNCRIHHGAIVGHVPQDLKFGNEPTTCEIGDRTVIREFATVHRGTGEGGRTVVGADCFLMGYVHIAHDCVIGHHVIMANAVMISGHSVVEEWVTIGGITPIHQFTHIGCHAMIGGGVRVPKDVPPYALASNHPLVFEGLNAIGLRRRGFTREAIEALHTAYHVIYRSGKNISQALDAVASDSRLMGFPEVAHVVEFIRASKRGIIGAPRLHA